MAEILVYKNGETIIETVIRGSDAFKELKGIWTGKTKLTESQEVQASQKTKAPKKSMTVMAPITSVRPQPKLEKQKVVKPETVEELKPGDWFNELQSLTAEEK